MITYIPKRVIMTLLNKCDSKYVATASNGNYANS